MYVCMYLYMYIFEKKYSKWVHIHLKLNLIEKNRQN